MSVRSLVIVVAAAAAGAGPIVVQSARSAEDDHAKDPSKAVYGGVEFALPDGWAHHVVRHDKEAKQHGDEHVGKAAGVACPKSSGKACTDGARVAFITYAGADASVLPALEAFEQQLDSELPSLYPGFRRLDAAIRPGADGTRYLSYGFASRGPGGTIRHALAAFRHAGGAGVVAKATGVVNAAQSRQVDELFASARMPTEPDAGSGEGGH